MIQNILVMNNQDLFSEVNEKERFLDAIKITASKIEDYILTLSLD